MKKKVRLVFIIGIFLIIVGLTSYFIINKNYENNPPSNPNNDVPSVDNGSEEPEIVGLDYDSAYSLAVSLYGGENIIIEMTETENAYVVYVKGTDNSILNTFNMDKKTGVISEAGITDSFDMVN